MQSIGGEICVLDPSPATERIMRLAGMERIITVQKSATGRECDVKSPQMGREMKRRSAHHKKSCATASVAENDSGRKGEVK